MKWLSDISESLTLRFVCIYQCFISFYGKILNIIFRYVLALLLSASLSSTEKSRKWVKIYIKSLT